LFPSSMSYRDAALNLGSFVMNQINACVSSSSLIPCIP
jgi:hypothetical protein